MNLNTKGFHYLNNYYRELWWKTESKINLNLETLDYFQKRKNEKNFDKTLNGILEKIKQFPKDKDKQSSWKIEFKDYLKNILLSTDILNLNSINEAMLDEFFCCSEEFINECNVFDPELQYSDIGQALRNVWIINILQKAMAKEIKYSRAIFGYSMLYPYTDNYLDNPSIPLKEKISFNNRFSKKLSGEGIKSDNSYEEKIYKLVDYIEEVFPRKDYPRVYEGLLAIHDAQKKSLFQQEKLSIPYDKNILGISIEKGGASVLADGFLVYGNMTEEEELFTIGYGFLLQLCDDLQDVKADLKNNHTTIFSQLAHKYKLDSITNKLINITITTVDEANCFQGIDASNLKTLIKDNCIYLILFAIANSKNLYTKEYIKTVSKYLPFRISYIKKLPNKAKKKFKNLILR